MKERKKRKRHTGERETERDTQRQREREKEGGREGGRKEGRNGGKKKKTAKAEDKGRCKINPQQQKHIDKAVKHNQPDLDPPPGAICVWAFKKGGVSISMAVYLTSGLFSWRPLTLFPSLGVAMATKPALWRVRKMATDSTDASMRFTAGPGTSLRGQEGGG